ncbi:aldolase [Tothia fuscella]|uniref:Aldolase n=1 Tax=Tothia fuscella TaxID=1048955 RepID=A0A9P4NS05_9PEZI|nr:aldolase [Tothia fuscella]
MATPPPRGVYVPVPTFFASKSASNYEATSPPLDVEAQAAHALSLAKAGIRGLVLLGSTGEAVHLTSAERVELVSGVRKELDAKGFKNYPLLAGTASQSVGETLQHLQESKDAGAQWGLVLAPGYFAAAVSQEGIAKWLEAIAEKSAMPILVYHYPGVSNNVALTPNTMERLAKHPKIVGCKLSHGAIDDHILIASNPNIEHSKFHTFTGLGQQLLPVLSIGGAGAIDGLAAAFPKSVVKLFEDFKETGSNAELRELQYKITRGEKLVVRWGTIGIREAVSRVAGFGDNDGGRLPLNGGFPDGDREWEKWRGAIEALQAVERSL